MSRLEMMNQVSRRFGFEAEHTIWFCHLAERQDVDDSIVTMAFVAVINVPVMESED